MSILLNREKTAVFVSVYTYKRVCFIVLLGMEEEMKIRFEEKWTIVLHFLNTIYNELDHGKVSNHGL